MDRSFVARAQGLAWLCLALTAASCSSDHDLIVEPWNRSCCTSCDSPALGSEPICQSGGVDATECPRRSACHDAHEFYRFARAYCCPDGCDAPNPQPRGGKACQPDTYAALCPHTSRCYKVLSEVATCELAQTHDAWRLPADAGMCAADDAHPADAAGPSADTSP